MNNSINHVNSLIFGAKAGRFDLPSVRDAVRAEVSHLYCGSQLLAAGVTRPAMYSQTACKEES